MKKIISIIQFTIFFVPFMICATQEAFQEVFEENVFLADDYVAPRPTQTTVEKTLTVDEYSEKYRCSAADCLKRFGTKPGLKYHLKKAHNIDELDPSVAHVRPYLCYINNCREDFEGLFYLEQHQLRKHDYVEASIAQQRADKKFACPIVGCKRVYSRMDGLRDHKKKVHPWTLEKPTAVAEDTQKFPCSITDCLKKFASKQALKYHLRAAHGIAELDTSSAHLKPYVCYLNDCGKGFENKFQLEGHQVRKHDHLPQPSKKKISCTVCNVGFTRMKNLKAHIKKYHPAADYGQDEQQTDLVQNLGMAAVAGMNNGLSDQTVSSADSGADQDKTFTTDLALKHDVDFCWKQAEQTAAYEGDFEEMLYGLTTPTHNPFAGNVTATHYYQEEDYTDGLYEVTL